MRCRRSWPAVASLLIAGLAFSGCAQAPRQLHFEADEQAAAAEVWPPAPEVPRYRFVGQLTGEANFRAGEDSRGFGRRVLGWLVGLVSGRHRPVVLQRPQAGYVDPQGRVFVTDVSRAAVYVFDEPAGRLRVWEEADRGMRFETPVGIAPGPGGEILVADAGLRRIVRLDGEGRPIGGFGADVLQRPTGLARDAERGRVYVADTLAHDIKVFDDEGRWLRTIGRRGEEDGELNGPTFVSFRDDRLYVSDTLNARIQVFSGDGEFIRRFGRRGLYVGDLPRPKGVAVDRGGHVYVVESYYDYLLVFNGNGELLLPIGGTGSGIGEFYLPAGVWTDDRARIYVADAFNGRIMIFQYLGEA